MSRPRVYEEEKEIRMKRLYLPERPFCPDCGTLMMSKGWSKLKDGTRFRRYGCKHCRRLYTPIRHEIYRRPRTEGLPPCVDCGGTKIVKCGVYRHKDTEKPLYRCLDCERKYAADSRPRPKHEDKVSCVREWILGATITYLYKKYRVSPKTVKLWTETIDVRPQ